MSDEMAMETGNETTATETGGATLMTSTEEVQTESPAQTEAPAPEATQEQQADEKPVEEDWDLECPEGVDPESVKKVVEGCKLLGMSKEVSQKVLDKRVQEMRAFEQKQRDWRDELATDKEFGGVHYGETVALARKALSAFDPTGAIRKLLDDSGHGNNPEVIKAFARAGRAMGEDVVISGKGGAADRPLADRLYND